MTRNLRFIRAIKRITSRDARYHVDAYSFMHRAVHFAQEQKARGSGPKEVHITCKELLDGVRRYGIHEYGPMAMRVFTAWGVKTTEDFGHIVMLMAEENLLGVREEDRIEEFRNAYDFHDAFVKPFMPSGKKVHVPVLDDE